MCELYKVDSGVSFDAEFLCKSILIYIFYKTPHFLGSLGWRRDKRLKKSVHVTNLQKRRLTNKLSTRVQLCGPKYCSREDFLLFLMSHYILSRLLSPVVHFTFYNKRYKKNNYSFFQHRRWISCGYLTEAIENPKVIIFALWCGNRCTCFEHRTPIFGLSTVTIPVVNHGEQWNFHTPFK